MSIFDKTPQKYFRPALTLKMSYDKPVYGFDIETFGTKNTFILGCITNGTKTFKFRDAIECMNFFICDEAMKNVVCVATNLKFDFFGTVSPYVKEHGTADFKILEKDGRIYMAQIFRKDGATVTFVDTLNYFPTSVEVLGEIIKIPKMEHPPFFPNIPKDAKEWETLEVYCENDALISCVFFRDFVVRLCDEFKIKVPFTCASIALNIIRTHFTTEWYKTPSHEDWLFIRDSYCGGHTEVFRRGIVPKKCRCYDVNSLYPYIMQSKQFPHPNYVAYAKHTSVVLIRKYHGFSYVEGHYPENVYFPCLPVKVRSKLLFPTGLIKGTFTHVELRQALDDGFHISRFGKSIFYTRVCNPFSEFVDTFYARRLDHKKEKNLMEVMDKLVMNASYGKWGFNYTESTQIVTTAQMTDELMESSARITKLHEGFWSVVQTGLVDTPPYAMMMWASYVTAYARLHLLYFMRKHKDFLCYVDTDSLFLMDGHEPIEDSKELGGFKLEKECDAGQAMFIAPKHYHFGTTYKIKGVRLAKIPKQKKMTDEAYKELVTKIKQKVESDFLKSITKQSIEQEQFASHRRTLRSKPTHKWGELAFNQIMTIVKVLKNEDTKRRWSNMFDQSYQDSLPHVLNKDDWKFIAAQETVDEFAPFEEFSYND